MRICQAFGLVLAAAVAGLSEASDSESRSIDPDVAYWRAIDADSPDQIVAGLRAVLKSDGDHTPARAELGQIEAEGRWLPVAYEQQLAADDPARAGYQQRLAEAADTVAGQRRLARWCEEQGLSHEARKHWLRVLEERPEDGEALGVLEVTRLGDRLIDRDVLEQRRERDSQRRRDAKEWERRFRRFEGVRRDELDELAAIRAELDVAAIAPVERRIAELGTPSAKRAAERARQLVNAFYEASVELPDVEVTASLCRVALMAPAEGDRERATLLLAGRPQGDSIPMLLSALVAPIDSSYRITRSRDGDVVYEHRLTREGEERDATHERRRTVDISVGVNNAAPEGFGAFTTSESYYLELVRARFEGLKQELRFHDEAAETNAIIDAHNTVAQEVNDRVVGVLERVSGVSLGEEPRAWWDHWRRETGYEDYTRPVERTYDVTYRRRYLTADANYFRLPPPPPRSCECFVAGTPVWTRDGRRAIESIEAGDLVLARDPFRGDLTYRVVTDTTTREPSPAYAITVGDESIRATEGHPFWVVNEGWRMAKQLRPGDLVSTVAGPTEIASVESIDPQRAYNLVVESAANYYVGETGVLVHDNTPRRPAVGLIARR